MRRVLRWLALAVWVGAFVCWLGTGTNRGWTKTSVVVKQPDPVTGLDRIVGFEPRFLPGVDFLGVAALSAGFLAGASFLFRSKQPTNQPNARPK